jgi:hypothetical protein
MNNPFGPTVPRGSVGAREAQLNAMREKGARYGVVELAAIITLEGTDRATELGGDPDEEMDEGVKGVGLKPQRKGLEKVGETIQDDKIVFVTREAEDGRGPEITVIKIKSLSSPGLGGRKGNTGMTIELTCMTKARRGAPTTRYWSYSRA